MISVLLVHATLLGIGASLHSPTQDEVGHMAAGISHWTRGTYDLYRVNPPLVRMIATLPVLCVDFEIDWNLHIDTPTSRSEFEIGKDFLVRNRARTMLYFTIARSACIPFSLLGAWTCYRWASELHGNLSGILAMFLWCSSPTILGHAQLMTPDVPAAATGIFAVWRFHVWNQNTTTRNAVLAGCALGICLLTKTTWCLLFAIWPLSWWLGAKLRSRKGGQVFRMREAAQMVMMFLFSLFILAVGYGFDGVGERLDSYDFTSHLLTKGSQEPKSPALNRFTDSRIGAIRIPLPRQYVRGLDLQKSDFESGKLSYLRGKWSRGGWWYYYLYAACVKTPVGTLVLFVLTCLSRLKMGRPWLVDSDLFVIPAGVAIVVFVSSQTQYNQHLRYILPAFPFAIMFMASVVRENAVRSKVLLASVAVAVAATSGESLLTFPHSLSFFNCIGGGPENGAFHLLGSNLDWGQDLYLLRKWIDEQPGRANIRLAIAENDIARSVGINCEIAPESRERLVPVPPYKDDQYGPQPGLYAVSSNMLRDYQERYSYFSRFRPIAKIGYTISIYEISPEQADTVRKQIEHGRCKQ